MNETYNPFLQIIKSYEGLGSSGVYYKLRRQKTGSKLVCALIVAVLLVLITFGISAGKLCADKDLSDFINEMPDFRYENGSFYVEKKYETTTTDTYVLVDTSVPAYYNDTDNSGLIGSVDISPIVKSTGEKSGVTQAMFVSETNLIQVNFITGQIQEMKFSELSSIFQIKSFSKSIIQSGYKSFIVKWAVILGILWLPVRFGLLFLTALIYCIQAQIGKAITKSEDDFNTIYWIAFYINIALVIVKALIKNLIPLGGGMLNMLFFALFIFIILKTLKDGDPEASSSQGGYSAAGAYSGYSTSAFGDTTAGATTSAFGDNTAGTSTSALGGNTAAYGQDELDAYMNEGNADVSSEDNEPSNDQKSPTGLSLKK